MATLISSIDAGIQPEPSTGVLPEGNLWPWCAVCVRPRFEKIVASALRAKQYEEFLPLYRKRNRWSDRVKEVDLPLFPGYVFCRADLGGRPSLVTTPGVIGFVTFGSTMATIPDEEIDAIRRAIGSGTHAAPWPYLREGQRVRIEKGALTGVEGILVQTKSECRVVLSVDVLCRSVAVEVDRDWLSPALHARAVSVGGRPS